MSDNKDKVESIRRWCDVIWSQGDVQTMDELLDPNFSFVLAFMHTDTLEAFKKLVAYNRTVFENLTYKCNDAVADGLKGACWWTMTSRHVGEWRHIPGSNKLVSIEGVTFFWFSEEGKFTKAIVENDVLGLMRQIGGVTLPYEPK
jgi:steroid delta-isomerase-like uncharacterized protein